MNPKQNAAINPASTMHQDDAGGAGWMDRKIHRLETNLASGRYGIERRARLGRRIERLRAKAFYQAMK
jgi:hypothetical protein